jgi:hypothetical protein
VLDDRQQPVPPGTAGELYIGGDGVAAGYLGDLDLTQASFVRNPLHTDNGGRLYRTGDRVRRLPDGQIDFLGRLDNQVKIHGYRIELGEIEAALREHPQVAEAVVMMREDTPGNCRLVGYLTAADPQPPVAELRGQLMATLPRYMIPAVLMLVPQVPRTPNGKVDRRALPRPASADLLRGDVPYVAPLTQAEEDIAAIWRSVLGLADIGVEENFFDAGGDSLLLMHVTTRLRAKFGEALGQVDMFAYPTVRSMAGHLSRLSSDCGLSKASAVASGATRRHAALQELRQRRLASRQSRDG